MSRNRGQRSSDSQSNVNTSKTSIYHYTNQQGIEGICKSGLIYPSTDTSRDAILGKAVYLTDVAPCNGKDAILQNNYGADPGRHQQDRADFYVKLPRAAIPTVKANDQSRGVYRSIKECQPLVLSQIEGVKIGRHGCPEVPL